MKECKLCQKDYENPANNSKYCGATCRHEGKLLTQKRWRERNPTYVKDRYAKNPEYYKNLANVRQRLPGDVYQIYRATCPDGKIYIGATTRKSLRQRLQIHYHKDSTSLGHHIHDNKWTVDDIKMEQLMQRKGGAHAAEAEQAFITYYKKRFPHKILNCNSRRIDDLTGFESFEIGHVIDDTP
jgi:predicted GIY-YIG superfamily endonuclease